METLEAKKTAVFGLEAGQGILFLHAHPDDETVATGSAIIEAAKMGAAVRVAIATDGGETTVKFENPDHPRGDDDTIETIRRAEAKRAIGKMGVPDSRQHYFGLPDGKLSRPLNRLRLSWRIARTILKNDVTVLVTPGKEGFDQHPDHIAVHKSGVFAAIVVRMLGRHLAVWALNDEGKGELSVPVNTKEKLDALSEEYSQFPMWTAANKPDRKGLIAIRKDHGYYLPQHTADYLAIYQAFIHEQETYDRLY